MENHNLIVEENCDVYINDEDDEQTIDNNDNNNYDDIDGDPL